MLIKVFICTWEYFELRNLIILRRDSNCHNSGGNPNPGVWGEKLDLRKPDICPCCSHSFQKLLQNISAYEC